ncbi:cellulose biosynthesis cyclic di-GMP-binding regulatory protein BcsB [Cereibacter sphaeroides]|uniref:cellulose biosynthesis cyclic di-GMP-binding regulatory protein BcsB n=1 Tax=Cereibacter sphaeroides TaxID=1063 RepID=UPI001F270DBF|nr:cellulose biosynthesis cyclic di-GMP-binding regulatory protein BcsB [Cereibacter sphaeroides]MCE6969435.1 cellulose biosynthesis cyclic di-GMP-binding regulatory protein BcsB [Cereibacter sphaeroides]
MMRLPILPMVLLAWGTAALAEEAPMIVIEGVTPPDTAAPATPAEAPSEVAPWLIPLRPVQEGADASGVFRLQGQHVRAAFRLFLPPAGELGTLTLAYRSSINVLPERSSVVVRVNGEVIGRFEPRQFGPLAAVTLPLGTSARVGENTVTIETEHRHRIYCGAEAEFAVWTEFDLRQSGLVLPAEALDTSPETFLAAVTAQAASGRPLEIRAAEVPDEAALRDLAVALGRPLPGEALPIALGQPWARTPSPSFARVSVLPSDADRVSIRRGGDGALVLVLEHPAGRPPKTELVAGLFGRAASGTPSALPLLEPGAAVPLSTLGLSTLVTDDRYYRRDLDFRLPEDWLLLATQKAWFGLDYGFAEGLPEGAVLLVKVNGTTVRMLPLDREAGPVKPRLDIRFPARLLRPGPNRLTFESIIPGDPADEPCPAGAGDLLAVLDSSELTVPPAPRMEMDDMARDLARLRAEGIHPATPEGLARALPFMAAFGTGPAEGEVSLTVAGLHDLGRVPMAEAGLTPRLLALALLPPTVSRLVERPEEPATGAAPVPLGLGPAEGGSPPLVGTHWLGRAKALVAATLEPAVVGARRLLQPGDGALADWLSVRKGVAVVLAPEPGRLWVVLGPDAEPAAVAAALARAPHSPLGPQGQLAVLGTDGRWSSWTAPGILPRLKEPLSPGNLRQVVGNVASARPPMLLGGMLGLAWISAAVALAFVVRTRGRGRK